MSSPTRNVDYVAVDVLCEAIGTAKTRYVVAPVEGKVIYIASALDVVVDGDNVLTFAIAGTAITGGTVTHPVATTAAGEVKACVPTGANSVKRGQTLSVATDGGGSVGQCRVTFVIDMSQ